MEKSKLPRYTVHLILPRFIWIETNKKMEVECVDQGDDQLHDASSH